MDFNSLYASNDTVQDKFTVNILGAPNNSTTTVISELAGGEINMI